MNFKIDLGLEEKRVKTGDIDLVAAAEDMARAESALTTCETERAIVVAAAENLERGLELSKAIAEKTQDEGVALAVGKEALTASLRMLGQASAASEITAGTESFAAGAEASEGMLAKLIAKAKEYAKKIWDYIRNLVAKVVKYVQGLFGKGEDTATQLKELLKKAKDDKRTNLKATEFDKATAERLIKNVKYLAKKQDSKGITDSALMDQVSKLETSFDDAKNGLTFGQLNTNVSDEVKTIVTNADESATMSTIRDEIKKAFGFNIPFDKAEIDYDDALKDDKDMIEDKLDSNLDRANVLPLVSDGDSLSVLVVSLEADDEDIDAYNKDDKTGKEAYAIAKKVVNSIRVKTVKVDVPADEVEEFAEKLEPIPFNSAENIVKKLEKVTKKADKVAKDLKKDTEKAVKDLFKAMDELEKTDAVKNNTPGVKGDATQLARAVISVVDAIAQADTKARAANIKNAARPKWGDIVKESVRLYEK